MYKKIIFLLVVSFFVVSCKQNKVIKSHGISYLEKREKLIVLNKTNKNDTVGILGQPATRGMTNNNVWIYIERTKKRGKLLKLGRSYLEKNNVLVIEFNKYGLVTKKDFYDKGDMNKLTFVKSTTTNEIKKENFVYSFLSSIRQKMESKKK